MVPSIGSGDSATGFAYDDPEFTFVVQGRRHIGMRVDRMLGSNDGSRPLGEDHCSRQHIVRSWDSNDRTGEVWLRLRVTRIVARFMKLAGTSSALTASEDSTD